MQRRLSWCSRKLLQRNSVAEEWDSSTVDEQQDDEAHEADEKNLAVGVGSSGPLVEGEPIVLEEPLEQHHHVGEASVTQSVPTSQIN